MNQRGGRASGEESREKPQERQSQSPGRRTSKRPASSSARERKDGGWQALWEIKPGNLPEPQTQEDERPQSRKTPKDLTPRHPISKLVEIRDRKSSSWPVGHHPARPSPGHMTERHPRGSEDPGRSRKSRNSRTLPSAWCPSALRNVPSSLKQGLSFVSRPWGHSFPMTPLRGGGSFMLR